MKISVIMPVYNSEKYLEAAISSVFRQTGAEIEIIAVEDSSTDSSAELLRSLAAADPRIKAYYNEKNVGVAEVRNRALEYASGDYLAFCDSDDIVPDGAYAALLRVIGKKDIAVGAYDNLYDSGRLEGGYRLYGDEKASLFKAMFSVSCLWTKLIKRTFVVDNELRFDPAMSLGEDVVFLANLVMKNPSYAVTDSLVYYHCHHDRTVSRSLTHVYTLPAFMLHMKCRREVLSICASLPEVRDYIYINFTPFITDFLPLMQSSEERCVAFREYRNYLLEYDFSKKRKLFRALVGVSFDLFEKITVDEYIEIKNSTLAREMVLYEFEGGRLGLSWIIKYFKAWLKFKMKKSR